MRIIYLDIFLTYILLQLQKTNTLADDECVKVKDLAVRWDLPRVTAENDCG